MKTKMKSIVVAGCALASAFAFGTITPSPCGETVTSCQQWFKTTGSGKISCGSVDGSYKATQALKIKEAWFVYSDDGQSVVLTGTRGKKTFTKTLECTEFGWNVYGKSIDKVIAAEVKSGKKVKLESEMYFTAVDADSTNSTVEVSGVLFGTVTAKVKSCNCGDSEIEWVPGTFSGKFIGVSEPNDCGCYSQMGSVLSCTEVESCTACGSTTTTLRPCLQFEESEPSEFFCGDLKLKWSSKNSGCIAR